MSKTKWTQEQFLQEIYRLVKETHEFAVLNNNLLKEVKEELRRRK